MPFYLIFILIVLNFTFISDNSKAVSAEVVIILDEHEIDYINEYHSSEHMYLSGNVTCNIEGFGDTLQRVDVTLWVGDNRNWYPGIAPSVMTFLSNGKKSFNISFKVPLNELNNSINTITVDGYWQTEPYDSTLFGGSGYPKNDQVNITFIKILKPFPDSVYEESTSNGAESFSWLQIILIIGIPTIILICVIIYLISRIMKMEV